MLRPRQRSRLSFEGLAPWCCLLLLLVFVNLPAVMTAQAVEVGHVWTPLNDQHASCGDDRFYFSGVMEAKESFWNFSHPVSQELGGFIIDKFRAASVRLMTVLTLGLAEPRFAYWLSYNLSILLSWGLLFWVLALYGVSRSSAALIATFIFLFIRPIWSLLFDGWDPFLVGLQNTILNKEGNLTLTSFNDHFRYLVLSLAQVFFWLLPLVVFLTLRGPRLLGKILLFLSLLSLPYSYAAASVFGFIFYFVLLIFLLWRNRALVVQSLPVVAAVILAWIILGLPQDVLAAFEFYSQSFSEVHRAGEGTSGVLLLRLALFPLLLTPVFWLRSIRPESRLLIQTVALSFAILIAGLVLIDRSDLLLRMISRGLLGFWLFTLALLLHESTRRFQSQSWKVLARPLLLLGLGLPLIASAQMGLRFSQAGMYQMPQERWDLYEELRAPTYLNRRLFSFDFEDLQLLGALTNVDLHVPGAEYVQKPEQAVREYLRVAAALGVPRSIFEEWLARDQDFQPRFRCAPRVIELEREDFRGLHTVQQLTYDPYLKTFAGKPIRREGRLTEEFLNQFLSFYEESPLDLASPEAPEAVILREGGLVDLGLASSRLGRAGFRLLYQRGGFEIWARSSLLQ